MPNIWKQNINPIQMKVSNRAKKGMLLQKAFAMMEWEEFNEITGKWVPFRVRRVTIKK